MRLSLLAQLTVPPVNEVTTGDGGLDSTVITIVIAVFVLALLLLLARRLLFKPKPTLPEAPKVLAGETATAPLVEAPKVVLPVSEAEALRLAEVETARKQADDARRKREALAAELKGADGKTKAELAAQAQALKEQEETAKKQAYQAQKGADAEEKKRHEAEREESKRLAAELLAKAKADEAVAKAAAAAEEKVRIEAQAGQTLFAGLQKTKNEGFMSGLNRLFGGAPKAIDENVLAELEEVLFTADIGVKTAQGLVAMARDKAKKNELASADKLKDVIRTEVSRIVDIRASHTLGGGGPPHVIMVVGVNGSGKTTTIGKLAAKATASGKKVVLAAGDTFRAAAAEQLDVWAVRAGAKLVKGKEDSDPSAVIFEAIKLAKETGADLVLADTAGRLHTKVSLMDELKKVKRVIDKAMPGAPHEVLLVLDSTNGQNAIQQARQFHDAVGITAIALTKLDGTAKGGVIIGICDELKLPVAWAGVGEKVADLRPFEPKEFVQALFD
jgi:fused signal recognition particle receptor